MEMIFCILFSFALGLIRVTLLTGALRSFHVCCAGVRRRISGTEAFKSPKWVSQRMWCFLRDWTRGQRTKCG